MWIFLLVLGCALAQRVLSLNWGLPVSPKRAKSRGAAARAMISQRGLAHNARRRVRCRCVGDYRDAQVVKAKGR
jgi:hypothetical protein